jgi:hypothetical protein
MKKDVLIKMTCLSATLILLSAITLILSNFKGEKPNDFSSENSYFNSIPKEENHFESGESNGNPLSDADKITETVALKIAAKYINTANAQIEKTKKEEIDTFVVENEFGTANISESGGSLVSFSKDDEDEIKNFSDQQCFDKANEIVKNYYSASFTPRYFESGEGECFMVFTSKNGGTLCNPDKIEITVIATKKGTPKLKNIEPVKAPFEVPVATATELPEITVDTSEEADEPQAIELPIPQAIINPAIPEYVEQPKQEAPVQTPSSPFYTELDWKLLQGVAMRNKDKK